MQTFHPWLSSFWRLCSECCAEPPKSVDSFDHGLVGAPSGICLSPKSLEHVVGYVSGGFVEAACQRRLLCHKSARDLEVMNQEISRRHPVRTNEIIAAGPAVLCCQLLAIMFRSLVCWATALGKMGSSVLCFYWLLTPRTKSLKKKKKLHVKKAVVSNARGKHGCKQSRQICQCRWVGHRRFKHPMKRYRWKGKRKRKQLLHWQIQGRSTRSFQDLPICMSKSLRAITPRESLFSINLVNFSLVLTCSVG